MIPSLKCLGPAYIVGLVYVLTITLCESKPDFGLDQVLDTQSDKGDDLTDKLLEPSDPSEFTTTEQSDNTKRDWSKFSSWGKRYPIDTPDKRKWQSFNSWGKRDQLNDDYLSRNLAQEKSNRDWSSSEGWGKEDIDDVSSDNILDKKSKEAYQGPLNVDKKEWSKFTSWGKRDSDETALEAEKRKWSQFNSWGKRMGEHEAEKRKWAQFNSWGKREVDDALMDASKRKWNAFTTWGKRDIDDSLIPDKRKWAQFSSWGKRFSSNDLNSQQGQWGDSDTWDKRGDKWSTFVPWGKRQGTETEADKRKWEKFTSWGKRDDDLELEPSKRQWSGFTTWGKRNLGDTDDNESGLTADKRGWSQFSSWRKRLRNARNRNWAVMGNWGKRRWAGLVTWGKRSGPPVDLSIDSVVFRLLHFFDKNGKFSILSLNTALCWETIRDLFSQADGISEKLVDGVDEDQAAHDMQFTLGSTLSSLKIYFYHITNLVSSVI